MPEEAKSNLPFEVVTYPDEKKPTLGKWAVDSERNAYIVLASTAGGGYEGTRVTEYYVLNLQGDLISITASPLDKTFSEAGTTMHWKVNQITLPKSLPVNMAEVIGIVRDAFRVIGQFFDGERYVDVQIELGQDLTEHSIGS